MTEPKFVDGIKWNDPHPNAPEFIKGKILIKVDKLIEYLKVNESNGWVNITLKESKGGKLYFELDTWKPEKKETKEIDLSQITF
jgi:hypothetical protein